MTNNYSTFGDKPKQVPSSPMMTKRNKQDRNEKIIGFAIKQITIFLKLFLVYAREVLEIRKLAHRKPN